MKTLRDLILGLIGCAFIFFVLIFIFSLITALIILSVITVLFYLSYFCKDLNRFYNLNFLLRIAGSDNKNKKSNAFDIYF